MDSPKFLIIALLLITAILAPSVITLANNGENTALAIDFNEEEKKEVNEKDFLFSFDFDSFAALKNNTSIASSFYLEKNYSFSRTIFLPPPKYIS